MKTHFFTFLVAITIALTGHTQFWQELGTTPTQQGNNPQIVSDNGSVYVAFMDNDAQDKLSVMTYNNGTWEYIGQQGIVEQTYIGFTTFAVSNDIPYLLSHNNQENLIVHTFDGTNWSQLGNVVSTDTAYQLSLITDNGTPYVAYQTSLGKSVKYYDGTNWVLIGNENFNTDWGQHLFLQVENGTPYILYSDFNGFKIEYYDGTSWVQIGQNIPFSGQVSSPCIEVQNGTPYISFRANNILNVLYHDGTAWVTIGDFGSLPYNSASQGNGITISSGGDIYAWFNNLISFGDLLVYKLNGAMTDWVQLGTVVSDTSGRGDMVIVNDTPHIAYRDNGSTGNIRVSKYDFGVGINEVDNLSNISLSPNPSNSIVTIQSPFGFKNINVLDSKGRIQLITKNTTIDITLFESGYTSFRLKPNMEPLPSVS